MPFRLAWLRGFDHSPLIPGEILAGRLGSLHLTS